MGGGYSPQFQVLRSGLRITTGGPQGYLGGWEVRWGSLYVKELRLQSEPRRAIDSVGNTSTASICTFCLLEKLPPKRRA